MAQTWESGHACALPLWTGLDTLGHHGSIIVDGLPARTQECSARICMRDAPPLAAAAGAPTTCKSAQALYSSWTKACIILWEW